MGCDRISEKGVGISVSVTTIQKSRSGKARFREIFEKRMCKYKKE